MSPPRAGSGRTPLGRLVDALRRRLRPERGAPPATVPGLGSGEETAVAAAMRPEAQERAATAEAQPVAPLAAEPERAVTADEPMPVTDAAVDADADAAPADGDAAPADADAAPEDADAAPEDGDAAPADADAAPEDADARFDAARDRLRSTITPPPDADDTD